MGVVWKDKRKCKGFPEMYRLFPMFSESDRRQFRRHKTCMNVIKCFGQRYGAYFAPEFMVHTRQHGDPFQHEKAAYELFPSGRTFQQYLFEREQRLRMLASEEDTSLGHMIIDLRSEIDMPETSDDDDEVATIGLSSSDDDDE